jgi:hypothetical protein
MDHAAMGHGAATAPQRPSLGAIQAGTVVAPAAPVTPGAPASTLAPDALDAPAPTSVIDAQRSAAMATEMGAGGGHGGHGGHGGTGTYRHVDAGRGPEAYRGPGDSGADAGAGGHEGHGAASGAARNQGSTGATGTGSAPPASEHAGHGTAATAAGQQQNVVYVCPMHPDVRSDQPGNCPICGMALEKRSE